jgi:hypothetical protein
VASPDLTPGHLPRLFWVYVAAAALIAAGYADFPLIAFHFGKTGLIAPVWIPVLYSLAMAADAMAALLLGRLFDRIGIGAMPLAPRRSAPPSLPWRPGRGDDRHGAVGHRHGRPGIGDARGNRAARTLRNGAPPMASSTPPMASPGSPGAVCSAYFTTGPCRRSPLPPSCCKPRPWRFCGGSYGRRRSGLQSAGLEGNCRRFFRRDPESCSGDPKPWRRTRSSLQFHWPGHPGWPITFRLAPWLWRFSGHADCTGFQVG